MRLRIEQVIIWPKDSNFAARKVDLRPRRAPVSGLVQVIRGTNETGKTALLQIIDYCFGSNAVAIPQDSIFATVKSYGLLLLIGNRSVLLARTAPTNRGASDDFFIEAGHNIIIPAHAPVGNANGAEFARRIDAIAGLDEIGEVLEEGNQKDVRPLLYDLTPFLLAPSEYMTRPSGLFQNGAVSLDRVKRMIPLALQAATAEYSKLRERLNKEKRRLRQIEERVRTNGQALEGLEAIVEREHQNAVRFGLIVDESNANTLEQRVFDLQALASRLSGLAGDGDAAAAWRSLTAQISAAKTRERQLTRQRAALRAELSQTQEVISATTILAGELGKANDRVAAFDWFASHIAGPAPCPLCGSQSEVVHAELTKVVNSIQRLRDESGDVQLVSNDFTEQAAAVEEKIREIDLELRGVSEQRLQLEGSAGLRAKAEPATLSEVSRMLGAIDPVVRSAVQLARLSKERSEVAERTETFKLSESRMAEFQFDDLFAGLESQLLDHIQYYADIMDLGHAENPVSISLRSLHLSFSLPVRSAPVRLDKLGSGKNWMGYKLAAHLALHELFHLFLTGRFPRFLSWIS